MTFTSNDPAMSFLSQLHVAHGLLRYVMSAESQKGVECNVLRFVGSTQLQKGSMSIFVMRPKSGQTSYQQPKRWTTHETVSLWDWHPMRPIASETNSPLDRQLTRLTAHETDSPLDQQPTRLTIHNFSQVNSQKRLSSWTCVTLPYFQQRCTCFKSFVLIWKTPLAFSLLCKKSTSKCSW